MSVTKFRFERLRMTLLAALALSGASQNAFADEPERAILTYRVAPELRGCPDEHAFAEAVAARLGYDPFVPASRPEATPRPVDVQISRSAGKLEGRLTLGPTRTLQSSSCPALVDSLAATLALIFDPLGEGPAKKSPPTEPAKPPPSQAPQAPESTVPASATPPVPRDSALLPRSVFWFAVRGSVGDTPNPTPGMELGGHVRFARSFSLEGALSTSLAGSTDTPTIRGKVAAFPVALLLGLCTHFESLFACGAVSGGRLFASASGTDAARADGVFTVEVALRGGAMIPVTEALTLRAALEVGVPLARASLAIDQHVLWTTAPVIGRLSFGLGIRL